MLNFDKASRGPRQNQASVGAKKTLRGRSRPPLSPRAFLSLSSRQFAPPATAIIQSAPSRAARHCCRQDRSQRRRPAAATAATATAARLPLPLLLLALLLALRARLQERQRHLLGGGVERLEVVVLALVGREDVRDDCAIVLLMLLLMSCLVVCDCVMWL